MWFIELTVWSGMCRCVQVCQCMCECVHNMWSYKNVCVDRFSNNEFSEFFLETRVQMSVAFNTYLVSYMNFFIKLITSSYEHVSFLFSSCVFEWDIFLIQTKCNKNKSYRKTTIRLRQKLGLPPVVFLLLKYVFSFKYLAPNKVHPGTLL